MINKKTVVVIGAGASKDLNLPLGPELKERVASILAGETGQLSRYFISAIHRYFGEDQGRATNASIRARQLSKPMLTSASIDNFVDQHKDEPDFVAVAKMAIAYAIAEAEKNSSISDRLDHYEIVKENPEYFLFEFMNIVVRGHQAENVCKSLKNITFVIFNYDRCVERFLDSWMRMRFSTEINWREEGPKFLHVYGSLGDYFDENVYNPFSYHGDLAFPNPHLNLPVYVDRIKVFTEQEDSVVRRDVSESIKRANAILFLGFGFEEQNMRFFSEKSPNTKVFATLFGMSAANSTFLKDDLKMRFSSADQWTYTVAGKASQLIQDFYHPLTRAVGSVE